jgi:hypothetical protein
VKGGGMGENNSTDTRVVPLFKYIDAEIMNRRVNLEKLFEMFDKLKNIEFDFKENQEVSYGKKEKLLPPPGELLLWFIDALSQYANNKDKYVNVLRIPNDYSVSGDIESSETIQFRKDLISGDREKYLEAVKALKKNISTNNIPRQAWYIFEGYSHPDIFIETDKHIFVGEAKRTEPHLTKKTTWLETRDQLIRHVDAAIQYNYVNNKDNMKKIYSFYIVERQNLNGNIEKDLNQYNDLDYIKKSLPYISNDDNHAIEIMKTYVGNIFWEDIKERFPDVKFIGIN